MTPVLRSLRTKLTVLYAGLFALVLLLIGAVVYSAIARNAERVVRQELTASSTVFDRIWALRTAQLENGAEVLASDYGFRDAIASRDQATISSALGNLKTRMGIDTVFLIGVDNSITAPSGQRPYGELNPATLAGLKSDSPMSGVFRLNHQYFQAVSVPVLAPTALGWVVFANKLDRAQMESLQQLSAIPLEASILNRDRPGLWGTHDSQLSANGRLGSFVEDQLKAGGGAGPARLNAANGASIALIKPLVTVDPAQSVVLMLRYPLARAMAPYQPLLGAMAMIGFVGIGLLVLGSWILAKGLTKPLLALQDAAGRLQRGETAKVGIKTHGEIARLAESFNSMAAAIGEREQRITHLALHDSETNLPNRSALEREVLALTETVGAERVFVAALGVERFAEVRGAIGHVLFAELMAGLGLRLAERLPGISRARLSTSVLGLVFCAEDAARALAFADDIRRGLEYPVRLIGNTIDVNLTLGVAGTVLQGAASSAIDQATIALDQARAARRQSALFDASAYGDPAANLSLMSDMRRSIEDGHMLLHHQPKLDLRGRTVIGTEALVRWIHPTRGFLPPDTFIGMAEETGHIRALTDWVLAQAIEDQRTLARAGHALAVSVNISGRLLGEPDFADAALALVAEAEGDICFEITETAVIENPKLALGIIERFAAAGVAISIDDYGTGLSSLTYLKQIKANELKIDKSFVLTIDQSQRDALLVRSTIDLAHGLGLKVTAEGVETEVALGLLSAMGCDLAQGYLIAKPMPMDKLLAFMQDQGVARLARA